MAQTNLFINLTTSGKIPSAGGAITLEGMYVNNTSSGVIKLWSGSTYGGLPIGGNVTPAIGYHFLGNLEASAGVYVQGVSGSWDITFRYKYSD